MSGKRVRYIDFQKSAREKLLEGAKLLYDAVATTLGPKGRNVAIARQWGFPIVVHDGVTVAREVGSNDPLVMMGVNLIREAAKKTNEEAGDGTTTATLLAYEIVREGMELMDRGLNPMVLRDEVTKACAQAVEKLRRIAAPVSSISEIERVATISSADQDIGQLVAQAVEKVGDDGLVTAEEGQAVETRVEYTEGMEIKAGWLSPYFVTNPRHMEAVVENPAIVVTDKQLTLVGEIMPLLESLAANNRKNVVIIAANVGGQALNAMLVNKTQGLINALAIKAPYHSENQRNFLRDIAAATGGSLISEHLGMDVARFAQEFDPAMVGSAAKVIATRDSTTIVGAGGSPKVLKKLTDDLRQQRDREKTKFRREMIEQRLALLSTGVAVVRVGAKTEVEMRERVERVKDAIGAARAAKEEGTVAGGGTAFLQARQAIKTSTPGGELLHKVLARPLEKLLINAGKNQGEIPAIIAAVDGSEKNFGYEVNEDKIVDMYQAGVIDPTKVVRLALENAVSVACQILTTDCLIVQEIEEK